MNRKSFLILIGMLLIVGGAGLLLFWQDLGAWRSSHTKTGSRLFEKLPVNDVASVRLYDGAGEVNLGLKDGRWAVKERGDYNASVQEIGDLLVKLPELKVVQTENVGATLLPRLNLVAPGKDVKPESAGTQLELSDKSGQVIGSMLLGKKVIKIEPSPLPIKQETPVGRYVLFPGNPTVLVLSDALKNADAKPAQWLAKDFFKADRIRSLTVSGEGGPWKIARDEEYGQWKFAEGAGQLDPSKAVAAVNALAGLTFSDVATDVKAESFTQPRTLVAETYDNLTYTIRLAKKPGGDDYYLSVSVTGEPPRARTPEKDEKPADKERIDKQFAETLKKLDERVKREKDLAAWTFVVPAKSLTPVLVGRGELVAAPAPAAPAKK